MIITGIQNCIGCGLCCFLCPTQAIKMNLDKEKNGFLYPQVDDDKCINCNKCVSNCIANLNIQKHQPEQSAFAQTKDLTELKTTTSGGVATALSKCFIEKMAGVVYGAAFDGTMMLKHIRCETVDDCEKIKGSKYIQSNIDGVYSLIEQDLLQNIAVLFIGTPCQCAALTKQFGNSNNFYVCDLLCNGVASPQVFKSHIDWLETVYKDKIVNYVFRPKVNNYLEPYELLHMKNGKSVRLISPWEKWGSLYYNALVMRESCYECKFVSKNRIGDLTFADIPESLINDDAFENSIKNCGATYITVNTEKGKQLISLINQCCSFKETEFVLKKRMEESVAKPTLKEVFDSNYNIFGLNKAKTVVFGKKMKFKGLVIKNLNKLKK